MDLKKHFEILAATFMASKKMAYRPKLFDDIASVLCFATGHYKCSKI